MSIAEDMRKGTMANIDFLAGDNPKFKKELIETARKNGFLTLEEADWEISQLSAFLKPS